MPKFGFLKYPVVYAFVSVTRKIQFCNMVFYLYFIFSNSPCRGKSISRGSWLQANPILVAQGIFPRTRIMTTVYPRTWTNPKLFEVILEFLLFCCLVPRNYWIETRWFNTQCCEFTPNVRSHPNFEKNKITPNVNFVSFQIHTQRLGVLDTMAHLMYTTVWMYTNPLWYSQFWAHNSYNYKVRTMAFIVCDCIHTIQG